jgi:hypothetical protein
MAQLLFRNGPLEGQKVDLAKDRKTVLGRSAQCDVALKVPGISRVHCEIEYDGQDYHVSDLGSSNGTYINGERVSRHVIQHGDILRVASIESAFLQSPEGRAEPGSEATTMRLPWAILGQNPVCEMCGTVVKLPGKAQEGEAGDSRRLCESCQQIGWIIGQQVGHFKVINKIGVGGMGTVFKAYQELIQRPVALKILKSELATDATALQRFVREARAIAGLSHPSIVQLYDVGEHKSLHYIAMEFVDGPTVGQILATSGFHDIREVLRIAVQTTRALAHAFEKGIVHRDVKPSNIMLTRDRAAKLTDFGLAKFMDEAGLSSITETGASMGTLDYMSPEHLRDARLVDHRGDIYSLGATLYHMLTGRPAFAEGTVMERARKIRSQPPPSPRKLNSKIPGSLSHIIQQMMAKDPDDRYQTPDELLRALLNVRKELKAKR